MSHDTEVARAGDEMIICIGTRESGLVDYRIGRKITVTWRGGNNYLCHTCHGSDRYQKGDHLGCAHIQRVEKWRGENFA